MEIQEKARQEFEKWVATWTDWAEVTAARLKKVVVGNEIEYLDGVVHQQFLAWEESRRSVVSDIVGRLEARIAELRAEKGNFATNIVAVAKIIELERQVAELKKEYGIEP